MVSVRMTPPQRGPRSKSTNGTLRDASSKAAARPLMPPPMMATLDTVEREQANDGFERRFRDLSGQRGGRHAGDGVHDVRGNRFDEPAMIVAQPAQLLIEPFHL